MSCFSGIHRPHAIKEAGRGDQKKKRNAAFVKGGGSLGERANSPVEKEGKFLLRGGGGGVRKPKKEAHTLEKRESPKRECQGVEGGRDRSSLPAIKEKEGRNELSLIHLKGGRNEKG